MKEDASVTLTKETLRMLDNLRETMKAKSLDEVIRTLIETEAQRVVTEARGLDRARVGPFTEEDRGEDRD